jgi:hypothetical protein
MNMMHSFEEYGILIRMGGYMSESLTATAERVISPEQEQLISTARRMLDESSEAHHNGPWPEAWDQWRRTTRGERLRIVLGWLSIRPTPPELEWGGLLYRPERLERISRLTIRDNALNGPAVELEWHILTDIDTGAAAGGHLVMYGTETIDRPSYSSDPDDAGGYATYPVWEQDLLTPVDDPTMYAVLQHEQDDFIQRQGMSA